MEWTVKVWRAELPGTVVELLMSMEETKKPDILKTNIDSFNIFMVEVLLVNGTFVQNVIIAQINEKTQLPIQFTINKYSGPFV